MAAISSNQGKKDQNASFMEESFEVIGVIRDSCKSQEERMKYSKFVDGHSSSVVLETMLYCPVSLIENTAYVSDEHIFLWTFNSINDTSRFEKKLITYMDKNRNVFDSFEIKTLSSATAEHQSLNKPLKGFQYIILLILIVISGTNTMSTMFFTIKERINEIGIKKAMGAKKIDILIQFVFEGMFLSLLSACISITVSIIATIAIGGYLKKHLYILFPIQYSAKNMLLPICIGQIYGLVFSLIPSLYGANIKVTDALRFE